MSIMSDVHSIGRDDNKKNMPVMGVEMTFRVPDNDEQLHHVVIDAQDVNVPDNVPWKEGQEPPKPPAGSFVYSGRHDHGILLPPRRRGGGANQSDTMARLIAAVQQAKERSNGYLTRIIQHEKKATPSPSINMEPSTKRTKVEKDE